jgi:hypothetical protein
VAQPGRAPGSGLGGRGFESRLPDHLQAVREHPVLDRSHELASRLEKSVNIIRQKNGRVQEDRGFASGGYVHVPGTCRSADPLRSHGQAVGGVGRHCALVASNPAAKETVVMSWGSRHSNPEDESRGHPPSAIGLIPPSFESVSTRLALRHEPR